MSLQSRTAYKYLNHKLLIPYLTFGFPTIPTFVRLFKRMEKIADIIEVGIPFSDPIADGPVIQKCSQKALANGVNLRTIFKFLKEIPHRIPIALMGYSNPFFKIGVKTLNKYYKQGLFNGLIIPDMPLEEAKQTGFYPTLPLIQLIAPTTPLKRALKLSRASSLFVYYISITGITGSRLKDIEEVRRNVIQLKKFISKPIAVGFGISSPSEAKEITTFADGIVVGSALLKRLEEGEKSAIKFLESIRKAIS